MLRTKDSSLCEFIWSQIEVIKIKLKSYNRVRYINKERRDAKNNSVFSADSNQTVDFKYSKNNLMGFILY